MPFNQPHLSDSWPPTVVRLSAADESEAKANDSSLELHSVDDSTSQEEHDSLEDNPFAYFLSSPEDSEEDEDLSAGIETPDSQSDVPIVRTVSPSDFQRRNPEEILIPVSSEEDYIYDAELFDADAYDIGVAIPMTLREFSALHSQFESRPRPGRTQSLPLFPHVTTPESRMPTSKLSGPTRGHVRGRTLSVHLPASSRRLRADSYPRRKPRSWQRPSDDVPTIPEESSSASNSSKESIDSKCPEERQSGTKPRSSSPNLTLTIPSTSFNPAFAFHEDSKDTLTPPLKLKATLEGEDPTQISVWERAESREASEGQKLFNALGSPESSPISSEHTEDGRLSASARVIVLEETPFPPEPVLRLPLRRKKTVRFALPELSEKTVRFALPDLND